MAAGKGKSREVAKAMRQQEVEGCLVLGMRLGQVLERVGPKFNASRDTVRKDIEEVRRRWRSEGNDLPEIGARRGEYLARLEAIRRAAFQGFNDTQRGSSRRFRSLSLAFDVEREIGRIKGITPAQNFGDNNGGAVRVLVEFDPLAAGNGDTDKGGAEGA